MDIELDLIRKQQDTLLMLFVVHIVTYFTCVDAQCFVSLCFSVGHIADMLLHAVLCENNDWCIVFVVDHMLSHVVTSHSMGACLSDKPSFVCNEQLYEDLEKKEGTRKQQLYCRKQCKIACK